jgi:hypothetical protein
VNRRAPAERRDVRDEVLDLLLVEEHAAAARLLAGLAQRHVAGAQVEVGRERADTPERRAEPLLHRLVAAGAEAGLPAGDARPVRAVADEAVAPVEVLAADDVARRARSRDQHEREQRGRDEPLHAWRQGSLAIEPAA